MKYLIIISIFLVGCMEGHSLTNQEMLDEILLCESVGMSPKIIRYIESKKVALVLCEMPEGYQVGDITKQYEEGE